MEKNTELCGIIPVNKPQGWTSFDVVAKLRGILKIRRLGHAGTLDPMATGVLPVFVGKATKACDIIPDRRKAYRAGFKLGVCTDTLDITGRILAEDPTPVDVKTLEEVKKGFVGEITQIPPMYSAVKVNGKRLYELAREGKTVERKPRKAEIEEITVESYDENSREGIIYVRCSKGTYIRTLIKDIGNKAGAGGIMTSLERTFSGGFTIDECLTPEEIQQAVSENRLLTVMKPLDRVFEEFPAVTLDRRCTKMYKNGVILRCGQAGLQEADDAGGSFRVYGSDGGFLGLACADFGLDSFKSIKNFY